MEGAVTLLAGLFVLWYILEEGPAFLDKHTKRVCDFFLDTLRKFI